MGEPQLSDGEVEMWHLADDRSGKVLFGLFVFAAVVCATLVFLFANRADDAWLGPQAEKQQQTVPPRTNSEPGK
jgi:hypothetical protein